MSSRTLILRTAYLLALASPIRGDEPTPVSGRVEFSDGAARTGQLVLAPGATLRLNADRAQHALALDQIREIRFIPEKEERVRPWRFKEAGQTEKEYTGAPYPVRYLRAAITLANGAHLTGHLFATPLYLTDSNGTEKIVLPAKQRGDTNDTLASLVYPTRVVIEGSSAAEDVTDLRVRLPAALAQAVDVAALTRPGLTPLTVRRDPATHEWLLRHAPDETLFLAVRTADALHVGWPTDTCSTATLAAATQAVAWARDFFDARTVAGVCADADGRTVYTLLLLRRHSGTTLEAERNRPWQLGVWRWIVDADTREWMLAGRGAFFRGLLAPGEEPPTVTLMNEEYGMRNTE